MLDALRGFTGRGGGHPCYKVSPRQGDGVRGYGVDKAGWTSGVEGQRDATVGVPSTGLPHIPWQGIPGVLVQVCLY